MYNNYFVIYLTNNRSKEILEKVKLKLQNLKDIDNKHSSHGEKKNTMLCS